MNYYGSNGTYILHCVQQRRQQHTDLPVPSDPIKDIHVNEVDKNNLDDYKLRTNDIKTNNQNRIFAQNLLRPISKLS